MNDHIPDVTKMISDGGPAYPTPAGVQHNDGMTLRDYFAAAALPQVDQRSHGTPDDIALECYQLADAMLKARETK